MIAVVFIVLMGLVVGAVSLFGPAASAATASAVPWWALAGVLAGMGWILPLMPLIRWMERPDSDDA